MAESFLTYRQSLWLKITLVLVVFLVAAYIMSRSQTPPHGGTAVGLTYGVIGFGAILLCMYYGIRRRSYDATYGSGQAWLSSHVYLGTVTLLIIPLHSGFRFGVNIHTLAFVLLVVVVLSGFIGAYMYLEIPRRFSRLGAELVEEGPDSIDTEFNRTIQQMRSLCAGKSAALVCKCEQEIQRGLQKKYLGWRLLFQREALLPSTSTLQEFQAYLEQVPAAERGALQQLAVLATRKRELEQRVASQMQLKNLLEAWLYIHLPVSCAMLAAVLIHILTVLYY